MVTYNLKERVIVFPDKNHTRSLKIAKCPTVLYSDHFPDIRKMIRIQYCYEENIGNCNDLI
ncbi:hypothetical protein GCM10022209_56610 [Chitinophaga oryziterrae]